jgi:hypothetical protein
MDKDTSSLCGYSPRHFLIMKTFGYSSVTLGPDDEAWTRRVAEALR